jgi:hypothetical protein
MRSDSEAMDDSDKEWLPDTEEVSTDYSSGEDVLAPHDAESDDVEEEEDDDCAFIPAADAPGRAAEVVAIDPCEAKCAVDHEVALLKFFTSLSRLTKAEVS